MKTEIAKTPGKKPRATTGIGTGTMRCLLELIILTAAVQTLVVLGISVLLRTYGLFWIG